MNAAEFARHLLSQFRFQTQCTNGTLPIDGRLIQKSAHWYLEQSIGNNFSPADVHTLTEQIMRTSANNVDELWDAHLAPILKNIEKAAESLVPADMIRVHHLHIGHMATGQLNAMTMPVPGHPGSYLVTLEDQVLALASLVATTISSVIPCAQSPDGSIQFSLDEKGVEDRLSSHPEITKRFTEILVSYAITGKFQEDHGHVAPAGRIQLAEMLTTAIDYFVVGHEYAHAILGHFDDTGYSSARSAHDSELTIHSWNKESDADLVGAKLALVAGEYDYITGFAAIGIYFDVLNIMDRAVSLLETGNQDYRQLGTHPPAYLRKNRIRRSLLQSTDGDSRVAEQLEFASEVSDTFTKTIDLLWSAARPTISRLHMSGTSAAPKWQKNLTVVV
ncbi:hypothetical protein [Nocardia carnea]|uniref:hypothetical protein n=1 Tax=Nocardia carnea TaxID=37328 RepID=UPI002457911E|nr:hypothetical protein [Nocardia carnea]